MNDEKYAAGWATTLDGEHIPVSADFAKSIMDSAEAADRARREAMPTSLDALRTMHDALTRLRDEGWSEAIYCPKDGTDIALIQHGSTGVFCGFYMGDWPKGYLIIGDSVCHPEGCLWKPVDKLTEAERALMDQCVEDERRMMDAHCRAMASLSLAQADDADDEAAQ